MTAKHNDNSGQHSLLMVFLPYKNIINIKNINILFVCNTAALFQENGKTVPHFFRKTEKLHDFLLSI